MKEIDDLDQDESDVDYNALCSAAYFDDIDKWTSLMEKRNDLANSNSKRGNTFLHIAASQNSLRILNMLVQQHPLHICSTNNWQETPLHIAVAAGYKEAVRALVAAGSSLSAQDKWGRTPLMLARDQGNNDVLSLLEDICINQGLDISPTSQDDSICDKNRSDGSEDSRTFQRDIMQDFLSTLQKRSSYQSNCTPVEKHIFSNLISPGMDGSTNANDVLFPNLSDSINERITASTAIATVASTSSANETIQTQDIRDIDKTGYVSTVPLPPVPIPSIVTTATPGTISVNSNMKRVAISKNVEFPGDPEALREMLLVPEKYNPAGKDMFGLAAIHKFASWDKVDLLKVLLPALSSDDINMKGGRDEFTCLHFCIDSCAINSLKYLLACSDVDVLAKDCKGRTAEQLALELGFSHLIDFFNTEKTCPR